MESNLIKPTDPAQKYTLMRNALRTGNLATVKKLAQEAHEERIRKHGVPGDWEAAKADVEKMAFPNEVGAEKSRTSLLKDLFINRKIEFDCNLDNLKFLFSELNVPSPNFQSSLL